MKILHTSDWHLGRSLYGQKRYREFDSLLTWLADHIDKAGIDCLLVCGDVFDTTTPSNRAQELYYRFLCRVATSRCRHVIIIGGNHDSPTFLNAPRHLLRSLNIHVIGAMPADPAEEIIELDDPSGHPKALVCAVPYLRDRDIRTSRAGESAEEKNAELLAGLRSHYDKACSLAKARRRELGEIPLIATGHLFTSGARVVEGDGVRELYVGSLLRITTDTFPSDIDYLALGHLHVPQKVSGQEHIRYSGSPLPLGFGEAGQQKKVIEVKFRGRRPQITEIPVPRFQPLARIKGSLEDIRTGLATHEQKTGNGWLEIEYDGDELIPNLRERIDEMLTGSDLQVLRVKNRRMSERILQRCDERECLDDLDVFDVFHRCLDAHEIRAEERPALIDAYGEIINSLRETDVNAE